VDHGKEAFGQLIVAGGDCAIYFQATEEALDPVAFFVERSVMFDFYPSVGSARNDGLYVAACQVGTDGVRIITPVCQKRLRRLFGQGDQRVICLAVCRLTNRQVEGDWSSKGISQAVKLTDEPAPRAAKSASMPPPFPPAAATWARTVVLSML
jgi:hypothetical protein